jgi:hypothetical protein
MGRRRGFQHWNDPIYLAGTAPPDSQRAQRR